MPKWSAVGVPISSGIFRHIIDMYIKFIFQLSNKKFKKRFPEVTESNLKRNSKRQKSDNENPESHTVIFRGQLEIFHPASDQIADFMFFADQIFAAVSSFQKVFWFF